MKNQSFLGLLFFSLLFSASVSLAQEQTFAEWLDELRAEALGLGINETTLDAAFALVEEPIPRVLELDKSQPEFVQTFAGYMRNRLSDARIEQGKEFTDRTQGFIQSHPATIWCAAALPGVVLGIGK